MKNNQKESEKAFQDWLESIIFVDDKGIALPLEEVENANTKTA